MTIVRDLLEDESYTIDGCDDALIGVGDGRAVYAWHLLVMCFMREFSEGDHPCICDCDKQAQSAVECECDCDYYTQAVEWIDHNVYSSLATYGEYAPIIVDLRAPFGGFKQEEVDTFFPMEYKGVNRLSDLISYLEEMHGAGAPDDKPLDDEGDA